MIATLRLTLHETPHIQLTLASIHQFCNWPDSSNGESCCKYSKIGLHWRIATLAAANQPQVASAIRPIEKQCVSQNRAHFKYLILVLWRHPRAIECRNLRHIGPITGNQKKQKKPTKSLCSRRVVSLFSRVGLRKKRKVRWQQYRGLSRSSILVPESPESKAHMQLSPLVVNKKLASFSTYGTFQAQNRNFFVPTSRTYSRRSHFLVSVWSLHP